MDMSHATASDLSCRETIDSIVPDLALVEAVARHGGRSDGLIPLVVIRPGLGRGKGSHLYEADMLARNAPVFQGWKMYVDHQSPEAKKVQGGLPRSMRDLGGFVKEAWWDPSYSTPKDAERGHQTGAVLGLAKPTKFMRSLIEDIPEAVGASISASATSVRPTVHNGKQVWLVEGIQPKGSVDWVTEAGAGGQVISMMEALEESWSQEEEEAELMGAMTDGELREWLARERPELLESLDLEPDDLRETAYEEEEDDMTPEQIAEALSTEEGLAAISPIVEAVVVEVLAPRLQSLIEAALEDERELMQAEADASANRKLQMRDFRELAHQMIRESRLLEAFQVPLKKRYDIVDGQPTQPLDVLDVREGATVVKTAEEVLREQVAADIEEQRALFAAANPTSVRGQGATNRSIVDATGTPASKIEEDEKPKSSGSRLTDDLLQESNFSEEDIAEMYAGI
jgi:hypothetical protein